MRDDDEGNAIKGLMIGIPIGLVLWAIIIMAVPYAIDAVAQLVWHAANAGAQ